MDSINRYTCEQGSNAWHELRCGRITASRFKDMMAGKSTATYKKLINVCAAEIVSEIVEESYTNDTMQRGIDLEPEAADAFSECFELDLGEVGFVTNDDYWPEFFGVSPDRLVLGVNELVEIKCPLMNTHVEYLKAKKLPSVYKYQVHGQMLITGAEAVHFFCYYPGLKSFHIKVERDEAILDEMKKRMGEVVQEVMEVVKLLK